MMVYRWFTVYNNKNVIPPLSRYSGATLIKFWISPFEKSYRTEDAKLSLD